MTKLAIATFAATLLAWYVNYETGSALIVGLAPALICVFILAMDIAMPSTRRQNSAGHEVFGLLPFWICFLLGLYFLLISVIPGNGS